jgi:hypothetical protein
VTFIRDAKPHTASASDDRSGVTGDHETEGTQPA